MAVLAATNRVPARLGRRTLATPDRLGDARRRAGDRMSNHSRHIARSSRVAARTNPINIANRAEQLRRAGQTVWVRGRFVHDGGTRSSAMPFWQVRK